MPTPNPTDQAIAQRQSAYRMLAGVAILVLVLVTGLQWWQLEYSTSRVREESLAQAKLRAAEVTDVASEVIAMVFRAVDMTSRDLVRAYLESQDQSFAPRVQRAIDRLPPKSVLQVAVIDANGYLSYSNLGMSERVYLGDREHFKIHVDTPGHDFFISRPLLGRVSRQWSIQFSRAIRKGDKFIGVVVLSIDPKYLHDAVSRLTLEPGDSLSILRGTGEVLARNTDQEAALGQVLDTTAPYLRESQGPSGTYLVESGPGERIERIVQWRRLDTYPVSVVLSQNTATSLGPVERLISEGRSRMILGTAFLWGAVAVVALMARRINRQRSESAALEFVAMHDALTGLHSRHSLMHRLDRALSRAQGSDTRLGVLYLDLDGFKPVNDRYGHAIGDEVLKAVAERLQESARREDLVARIGGDEFVVVIDPLKGDEALPLLRDRIMQSLQAPLQVGELRIPMHASIGLAAYPQDGQNADALLNAADIEMYQHKSRSPMSRRATAAREAAQAAAPAPSVPVNTAAG